MSPVSADWLATQVGDRCPLDGTLGGLPDLRRALFSAAGLPQILVAQNFDPILANAAAVSSIADGGTRYYACPWPGGVCTGHFYLPMAGSYTDSGAKSGTALYSSDGTTLTRQAAKVGKIQDTPGVFQRAWTSPSSSLAAGIYYVGIRYVESAVSTAPTWAAIQAEDSTVVGADTAQALTPANWPLIFSQTDATQALPTSVAISGLGVASTGLAWVGLY